MNAPTFSRICAHSGSSFGSNTTHWVLRYRLSSRNSASRRTGTYFHSSASTSSPRRVRAPQTTVPMPRKVRRQLMPRGLSRPFSASVSVDGRADARRPGRPRCRPAPSRRRGCRRCGRRCRRSRRRRRSRRLPHPATGRAADPREVDRGVPHRGAGEATAPVTQAAGRAMVRGLAWSARRVDDQERPLLGAERSGLGPQRRRDVGVRRRRRDAEEVEQVGLEQRVDARLGSALPS